jgi:3'-phosphoadenosine 5'-phosphosulfate (PAPS) 3'-phosphatase
MEWDTAAGNAILTAAGGRVETPDGEPLTYGKAGFEKSLFHRLRHLWAIKRGRPHTHRAESKRN